MFNIFHTDEAREQLNKIKIDRGLSKRYKAVKKAIEFLSLNPRHPGLQTHEFTTQRKSDHHYRNHSSSIDRINPTKNPFALSGSKIFIPYGNGNAVKKAGTS